MHGRQLVDQERYDDALAVFDRLIRLEPGIAVGHTWRARALAALGRSAQALESADRALELDPAGRDAWRWKGRALLAMDQAAPALRALRLAEPGETPTEQADHLADIGYALGALGRRDEALAAYDAAVARAPGAPLARYRRGFMRLLAGDFSNGWGDHEARWARRTTQTTSPRMTPAMRKRLTLSPTVDDLRGQRVLVVDEQGVGDVIMFASVLPDLADVAASVTCLVESRLLQLFAISFPDLKVVAGQGPALVDLEEFDRVVAIGSLPHAFRRHLGDFPGRPYLAPRASVTETWRSRLGHARGKLRVGFSWRGGLATTRAQARSMSLETLRPLIEREDVEAVSLQYGDVQEEVAVFNHSLGRPMVSFPRRQIEDFEQLAGLVCALDVIVTVQTALAHLTGAVGARGIVMIPAEPEWRYLAAGDRLPWYQSVRLVRQTAAGDWGGVIDRVGAEF